MEPRATAWKPRSHATSESWWMHKDRAQFTAEIAKRFAVNKQYERENGLAIWPHQRQRMRDASRTRCRVVAGAEQWPHQRKK